MAKQKSSRLERAEQMSHPDYKSIGKPPARLIEECSELIHALCKAERFGWFDRHPITGALNIDYVKSEMADVIEAMERVEVEMRQMVHDHYKSEPSKEEVAGE